MMREDVIDEELEEDPEEAIYEEYEEDPEEEIVEDPEEVSEKGINGEPDEEKLSCKYSHHSSATSGSIDRRDLVNEVNKDSKHEGQRVWVEVSEIGSISKLGNPPVVQNNILSSLVKDLTHQSTYLSEDLVPSSTSNAYGAPLLENAPKFGSVKLGDCKLQRKKLAQESLKWELDVTSAKKEHDGRTGSVSRLNVHPNNGGKVEVLKKRKQSRWEFNQEEGTSQADGESKRRKSRWDNNDSENTSIGPSGFIGLLQLPVDPKMISLQAKLIEVRKKLQGSEPHDERPPATRSPSPEPVDNNLGIRISTRDTRMQKKLLNERLLILSKLTEANLAKPKPVKCVEKLFIPNKEYPTYNFVGLILGPKGNTIKKMEIETGARIYIRGRGSGDEHSENEDLHVRVEADSQGSLETAVAMVKKLLVPVADQNNHHKKAQLAELAKMKGMHNDNVCQLCKEEGHKKYACPFQDTTFTDICCGICGSVAHSTPDCGVSKSAEISMTLLGISGADIGLKEKSSNEVDLANLYVRPLPHTIDDDRLRDLFLPFGRIIKTTAVKDQTTGLCKGFGFVRFEDPSDAAAAMKYMNGYKLDGKVLAVRVAGQKAVPGSLHSGHVPAHVPQIAVPPPSNVLAQRACIYEPSVSMVPVAPFTTPNNGSLYPYSSFPGNNFNVARMESPIASSSYDFCDKVVSSSNDSMCMFPGTLDYTGS